VVRRDQCTTEDDVKVFPFLKTVLDEVWDSLPAATPAKKKALVQAQGQALRAKYAKLATAKAPIDYEAPATRYAYIACYVSSHANMVADLIQETPAFANLFKQPKVTVCCIGGGPGSDLVGVLKHVENAGLDPKLMFWLFDREQAWSDSWADVDEKLKRQISTYFTKFDVTDPATYTPHSKYLQSDLFTMVYFISELNHCRDDARPFFENLFAKAKDGAMFLFIDNSSSEFYDWFDATWKAAGLKLVTSNDSVTMRIPNEEEKTDLGQHFQNIDGVPKIKGSIAYRVLRKE
jgi:hypothetical protein